MTLRSLSAALLLALLVAPRAARAEGPGLALGENSRLHLSFESELRFDTLAGQGGIGTTANPVWDPADFILHIRPGARFVEQGTTVGFTGAANIDYVDYTGWLNPTHDLSYLAASVAAALDVAKSGPIGFSATENFTRSDHSSNPSLAIGTITDANDIGGRLSFRPGGGAIEGGVAYNFGLEAYELHAQGNLTCGNDPTCNGADYGNFNSTTHRFALDARWRFFPKTAVVFDSSFQLRNYGNGAANVSTMPLVVQAGLAGLVTEKVRVVLKVGYANSFSAAGDGFSSVVGQVEAGWDPSETAGISIGASRSVQPVSGAYGWYDDWRGFLTGKLQLWGRVQLTANGGVDIISYANDPQGRQDTQMSGELAASVEIFRMLHVTVGAIGSERISSLTNPVYGYQRLEAYVRLNFTY